MKKIALFSILAIAVVAACQPSNKISRIDPGTNTDLSGKWNDTDARMMSETLISDALTKPWLNQHSRNTQKPPIVIVGNVRNETTEHIETEVITKELERAFINSGSVTVVASRDERVDVRDERIDQQDNASVETTKKLGQELGADYMLIGNINSIVDEAPNRKDLTVFYVMNLELIDIQTNRKVWIGDDKIKKLIQRKNYRGR